MTTLWACTNEPPREGDLGGLLRAPKADTRFDVDTALADPGRLARALDRPHAEVAAELGSHRVRGDAKLEVSTSGALVETLTTTTEASLDGSGRFHAKLDNDKEYGREVIFDGTDLFLRPRYGKYHRRLPESDGEPATIVSEILSTPAAHFDLLEPGLTIKSKKDGRVGERAAIVIELEPAGSPRPPASEALTQRKWRETRKVQGASGTVTIDRETGALLAAQLRGTVAFTRDGANYEMRLDSRHAVEAVGAPVTIEVPDPDMTVTAPRTLTELDEREQLLRGIAPPARRGRTPQNPTGEASVGAP